MAGETCPMETDDVVITTGNSRHVKSTPWVEKYRPQSLADVAAHRDIVDTSKPSFSTPNYIL